MIHFLRNVMIAGGLLQIATFGAGALSFDNRAKRTTSYAGAAVNRLG
jgi:putative oxidoreductase